jgi:hypothetical protein
LLKSSELSECIHYTGRTFDRDLRTHDGATRHRQYRRRPYRLLRPLRLPDEQRQQRGTTLTCTAPVGGHGTTRAPHAPSTRAFGPASPASGCTCTRRLCTAQRYGHTHTHTWGEGRGLAREWRVEMVLRRATSRPRWCRLLKRTLISSLFARSLSLLAESTRSRHDVFTRSVQLRADRS